VCRIYAVFETGASAAFKIRDREIINSTKDLQEMVWNIINHRLNPPRKEEAQQIRWSPKHGTKTAQRNGVFFEGKP
jgi:hypothetical protein